MDDALPSYRHIKFGGILDAAAVKAIQVSCMCLPLCHLSWFLTRLCTCCSTLVRHTLVPLSF